MPSKEKTIALIESVGGSWKLRNEDLFETIVLQKCSVDLATFTEIMDNADPEKLFIDRTELGNDALDILRNKTRLRELMLMSTRITNEGLRLLRDLDRLQVIGIDRNEIDDEGIKAWRAALPLNNKFPRDTSPGHCTWDCGNH